MSSSRGSDNGGGAEENGTTTASSSPRGQLSPQNSLSEDMFVRHKVSKLDTLAGLAIRYHVTVSDIKRANGLLSDTAMFARDTLLIPTRPLPIGAEYSTWAGMIVMQYGKLRAKERCPAKVQYGKLTTHKTSIDELRGYYSTSPGASPKSMSDDEDGRPLNRGEGYDWRNAREVELMTRNTGGASTSYAEERLRRRGKPGEADEASSSLPAAAGAAGGGSAGGMMSFLQRGAANLAAQMQRAQGAHDLRRPPGRRKESLLERLKKVASQPVLAVSSAPVSMAAAADAVISSVQGPPPSAAGAKPSEQSATGRPTALGQAAYNLLSGPKEGTKAD